jgi:anti-sigma factor ChrR (cupin superfamily)
MTSEPERELFRAVKADDLPWRPSAVAAGVHLKDLAASDGWQMQLVRCEPGARFPVHTHAGPEFLLILEGELVQGGRRLGPGWASVASAGSVDDDVRSDTGCIFVLVERC